MVENTDASLGELIGQVYVTEYLPKCTKEKLLEIGNNIRDVYAGHIKSIDWMSDVTKQKALSKLNKIVMKVGYPDKWKDMSSLEITHNSYLQNVINVVVSSLPIGWICMIITLAVCAMFHLAPVKQRN